MDSSQKNPTWFGSILSKTNSAKGVNLPIYFDLLLDSSSIQTLELEKASVHEKKKTTYELTKKLTDFSKLSHYLLNFFLKKNFRYFVRSKRKSD